MYLIGSVYIQLKFEKKFLQKENDINQEIIQSKNEVIKTKSIQKRLINKPDVDADATYRLTWLQLLETKRDLYNKQ